MQNVRRGRRAPPRLLSTSPPPQYRSRGSRRGGSGFGGEQGVLARGAAQPFRRQGQPDTAGDACCYLKVERGAPIFLLRFLSEELYSNSKSDFEKKEEKSVNPDE